MPGLVRFGVTMEPELLARFDRLVARRGHNRSEALRDLVRGALVEAEVAEPDREVVGTLTMVFDHHAGAGGELPGFAVPLPTWPVIRDGDPSQVNIIAEYDFATGHVGRGSRRVSEVKPGPLGQAIRTRLRDLVGHGQHALPGCSPGAVIGPVTVAAPT